MDVFGVIPARGGSTRVERKNIREVGEKPLIAHTIEQAESADSLDYSIVSTDDEEIRSVAREHGGEVPFLRPAELATDTATSPPVVLHALDWIAEQGHDPDIVVMLQPTTPLRTAADIDGAVERLRDRPGASTLVSVTEYEAPPHWAIQTDDDGFAEPYFKANGMWTDDIARSQDMPVLHRPNGAIFAAKTGEFRSSVRFYTDATLPYEMPRERSFDVDDPADLSLVRKLL